MIIRHQASSLLTRRGLWLTALAMLGMLLGIMPLRVLLPNQYVGAQHGDTVKNLFTTSWYVLHADSYSQFEGHHYPYTDHITFQDVQPPLAVPLKWVHENVYPIGEATPGIVDTLMLLSFIIGGCFVFLLLRWYGVRLWASVLFTLALMLMTPHWYRLRIGQFALAYAHAIPVLWYLLLRWLHHGRLKWMLLAALHSALMISLHLYYLAILGAFAGVFLLVSLPRKWQSLLTQRRWWVGLGALALSFALPVVLYQVWFAATGTSDLRIERPWGFFVFTTSWASVLMPRHVFMLFIEDNMWGGHLGFLWSGYAYPGVVVWLALLSLLADSFWRKLRGQDLPPGQDRLLWLVLGSGLIYAVATAAPFEWVRDELFRHLPQLLHFRQLGRIIWGAFMIWMIVGGVWLFRRLWQQGRMWQRVVFVLAIVLLLTDGVI